VWATGVAVEFVPQRRRAYTLGRRCHDSVRLTLALIVLFLTATSPCTTCHSVPCAYVELTTSGAPGPSM
jgi:hypothetical protein